MSQACDTTIVGTCRTSDPVAEPAARHGKAVGHAVILAICAGTLGVAFLLRPGAEGSSLFGYAWPWRCWLHDTFGVKCALCGLTRSFCYMARANFAAALEVHPLGPTVFGLFCLEVPYRAYALAIGPRSPDRRLVRGHAAIVAIVSAAVLVNWLLYLGDLIA